jgi:GT2 family glycosyltransferase
MSNGGEIISSITPYLIENPGMEGEIAKGITPNYAEATSLFVGKSAIPDVRGAFNILTGYKGFDLSAQFLYQIGGYAYDGAYATLMNNDVIGGNNWHVDILNRWQEPGDLASVPRVSSNYDRNVNSSSTRYLTKADYLSLNNIRLGYTVPKAFFEGIGISVLNIYVSGDNLAIFTKRDGFNPSVSEVGASSMYNYSPLSTITGGVRINF